MGSISATDAIVLCCCMDVNTVPVRVGCPGTAAGSVPGTHTHFHRNPYYTTHISTVSGVPVSASTLVAKAFPCVLSSILRPLSDCPPSLCIPRLGTNTTTAVTTPGTPAVYTHNEPPPARTSTGPASLPSSPCHASLYVLGCLEAESG